MTKINLIAPSRIHLCLINESGIGEYIHGGLGFAIESPCNEIIVSDENNFKDNFDILSDEHKSAVILAINRLSEYFNKPKINIKIIKSVAPHSGLGSKTILLLSIAFAFCKIFDIEFSLFEIIKILQRYGASGVGMYCWLNGGFVEDGGFQNINNITDSSNFYLQNIYPVEKNNYEINEDLKIVHFRFKNGHIYGNTERELIKKYYPINLNETNELYKIVNKFIESLLNNVNDDIQFYLNIIQNIGFKKYEWAQQDDISIQFVNFTKKENLKYTVGLSSWGPTMYFITYDPEIIINCIKKFCKIYNVSTIDLTISNICNNGFTYKQF